MVQYRTISHIDAPEPPAGKGSASGARRAYYDGLVRELRRDEALIGEPEEGETARGIAMRLTTAGRRTGIAVEAWHVDGVAVARLANG